MEKQAEEYFAQIEQYGGVVEAIEAGFFQHEIADASYRYQRSLETKERVIVGVNAFERDEPEQTIELLKISAEMEREQARDVQAVRAGRDAAAVESALAALKRACADDEHQRHAAVDRRGESARDRGRDRRRDGFGLRPLRRTRRILTPERANEDAEHCAVILSAVC